MAIQKKTQELLKAIDPMIKPIDRKNVLIEDVLQDLVLTYVVDIKEQTEAKQKDKISCYPTDLVSSLKVFSDLYFKMKIINEDVRSDLEIE